MSRSISFCSLILLILLALIPSMVNGTIKHIIPINVYEAEPQTMIISEHRIVNASLKSIPVNSNPEPFDVLMFIKNLLKVWGLYG